MQFSSSNAWQQQQPTGYKLPALSKKDPLPAFNSGSSFRPQHGTGYSIRHAPLPLPPPSADVHSSSAPLPPPTEERAEELIVNIAVAGPRPPPSHRRPHPHVEQPPPKKKHHWKEWTERQQMLQEQEESTQFGNRILFLIYAFLVAAPTIYHAFIHSVTSSGCHSSDSEACFIWPHSWAIVCAILMFIITQVVIFDKSRVQCELPETSRQGHAGVFAWVFAFKNTIRPAILLLMSSSRTLWAREQNRFSFHEPLSLVTHPSGDGFVAVLPEYCPTTTTTTTSTSTTSTSTSTTSTSTTVSCVSYMGQHGCAWTRQWSCPGQRRGSKGKAAKDNSIGYQCCCMLGNWQQVPQTISSSPFLATTPAVMMAPTTPVAMMPTTAPTPPLSMVTTCPENYPVCSADKDCVIVSCQGGACSWVKAPTAQTVPGNSYNYIDGYNALGAMCTGNYIGQGVQAATTYPMQSTQPPFMSSTNAFAMTTATPQMPWSTATPPGPPARRARRLVFGVPLLNPLAGPVSSVINALPGDGGENKTRASSSGKKKKSHGTKAASAKGKQTGGSAEKPFGLPIANPLAGVISNAIPGGSKNATGTKKAQKTSAKGNRSDENPENPFGLPIPNPLWPGVNNALWGPGKNVTTTKATSENPANPFGLPNPLAGVISNAIPGKNTTGNKTASAKGKDTGEASATPFGLPIVNPLADVISNDIPGKRKHATGTKKVTAKEHPENPFGIPNPLWPVVNNALWPGKNITTTKATSGNPADLFGVPNPLAGVITNAIQGSGKNTTGNKTASAKRTHTGENPENPFGLPIPNPLWPGVNKALWGSGKNITTTKATRGNFANPLGLPVASPLVGAIENAVPKDKWNRTTRITSTTFDAADPLPLPKALQAPLEIMGMATGVAKPENSTNRSIIPTKTCYFSDKFVKHMETTCFVFGAKENATQPAKTYFGGVSIAMFMLGALAISVGEIMKLRDRQPYLLEDHVDLMPLLRQNSVLAQSVTLAQQNVAELGKVVDTAKLDAELKDIIAQATKYKQEATEYKRNFEEALGVDEEKAPLIKRAERQMERQMETKIKSQLNQLAYNSVGLSTIDLRNMARLWNLANRMAATWPAILQYLGFALWIPLEYISLTPCLGINTKMKPPHLPDWWPDLLAGDFGVAYLHYLHWTFIGFIVAFCIGVLAFRKKPDLADRIPRLLSCLSGPAIAVMVIIGLYILFCGSLSIPKPEVARTHAKRTSHWNQLLAFLRQYVTVKNYLYFADGIEVALRSAIIYFDTTCRQCAEPSVQEQKLFDDIVEQDALRRFDLLGRLLSGFHSLLEHVALLSYEIKKGVQDVRGERVKTDHKPVKIEMPFPPPEPIHHEESEDEGGATGDVSAEQTTPVAGLTELIAAANPDDMTLEVASVLGFDIGMRVIIDASTARAEIIEIAGFGSILLKDGLKFAHAAGTSVSQIDILRDDEVQWRWGDRWLFKSWNDKKTLVEAKQDLDQVRQQDASRPVEVLVQRTGNTIGFDSVAQAKIALDFQVAPAPAPHHPPRSNQDHPGSQHPPQHEPPVTIPGLAARTVASPGTIKPPPVPGQRTVARGSDNPKTLPPPIGANVDRAAAIKSFERRISVLVIGASNLGYVGSAAQGKNAAVGFDAYVAVHMGSESANEMFGKTHTESGKINPVWKRAFDLPLRNVLDDLIFDVWDAKGMGLLGRLVVPIQVLDYKIIAKGKAIKVKYDLQWLSSVPQAGRSQLEVDINVRPSADQLAQLASIASAREEESHRKTAETTIPQNVPVLGNLTVRVLAAYKLMDSTLSPEIASARAAVHVEAVPRAERVAQLSQHQSQKMTQTILKNPNPRWKSERFVFPVHTRNGTLVIEVVDEKGTKFMGRSVTPVGRLISHGRPGIPFVLRKRLQDVQNLQVTEHGEIEFEITYELVVPKQPPPVSPSPAPGSADQCVLLVSVIRGGQLTGKNGGSANAFVAVRLEPRKQTQRQPKMMHDKPSQQRTQAVRDAGGSHDWRSDRFSFPVQDWKMDLVFEVGADAEPGNKTPRFFGRMTVPIFVFRDYVPPNVLVKLKDKLQDVAGWDTRAHGNIEVEVFCRRGSGPRDADDVWEVDLLGLLSGPRPAQPQADSDQLRDQEHETISVQRLPPTILFTPATDALAPQTTFGGDTLENQHMHQQQTALFVTSGGIAPSALGSLEATGHQGTTGATMLSAVTVAAPIGTIGAGPYAHAQASPPATNFGNVPMTYGGEPYTHGQTLPPATNFGNVPMTHGGEPYTHGQTLPPATNFGNAPMAYGGELYTHGQISPPATNPGYVQDTLPHPTSVPTTAARTVGAPPSALTVSAPTTLQEAQRTQPHPALVTIPSAGGTPDVATVSRPRSEAPDIHTQHLSRHEIHADSGSSGIPSAEYTTDSDRHMRVQPDQTSRSPHTDMQGAPQTLGATVSHSAGAAAPTTYGGPTAAPALHLAAIMGEEDARHAAAEFDTTPAPTLAPATLAPARSHSAYPEDHSRGHDHHLPTTALPTGSRSQLDTAPSAYPTVHDTHLPTTVLPVATHSSAYSAPSTDLGDQRLPTTVLPATTHSRADSAPSTDLAGNESHHPMMELPIGSRATISSAASTARAGDAAAASGHDLRGGFMMDDDHSAGDHLPRGAFMMHDDHAAGDHFAAHDAHAGHAEADIRQLMEMGFSREQCEFALEASPNVDQALDLLLSQAA